MTDKYGPRLTGEEYDRRIVALHSGLPPIPSWEEDQRVRRAALDLAIDHRLGRGFPQDRRDALWTIQQRLDRKRIKFMGTYLLKRLFRRSLAPEARGLAGYVIEQYATILDPTDLRAFFGDEEVRNPALPLNERD
ncbi:MAG: hypothetical protein M3O61_08805 [Gemmatimonadota bacterium]|nr:hypothetical protein [Gemmatimonadota bacterium]